MKKLLIIAPLAITLAACSSNPFSNPFSSKDHVAPAPAGQQAHSNTSHSNGMASQRFTCTDGASVQVKYSASGDKAMVTASLPKANWNNQSVTLNIAPSGSGTRYVNTTVSPTVNYEWHTKGNIGIMTLDWKDGINDYSVTCDAI